MRRIDCSKFGKITGVWEIGPIISGDRWIPDVLCRSLPQLKGPHPVQLGHGDPTELSRSLDDRRWRPNPSRRIPCYEYYVDYCVFFGSAARGRSKSSRTTSTFSATWASGRSRSSARSPTRIRIPGQLMLKLLGPGLGTGFGPAGGSSLDFAHYPPPWEIEICFTAPDDSIPWNLFMNFIVVDKDGKNRGGWTPGVENFPAEKRHQLYGNSLFKLKFDRTSPSRSWPISRSDMLIQCVDHTHVRLGFKAAAADPWLLSQVYDASKDLGTEIGRFDMHSWSSATGEMYGAPPGGPMYQKFLVDFLHYRNGLSVK